MHRSAPRSVRVRRRWAVGVDLGGTWLRGIALTHGTRPLDWKVPAPGLTTLPRALRAQWRRWGFRRDGVEALVVASRGIWTAAERRALARRLYALARRVRVVSDAEGAYQGALGRSAGIVLLAGTGSLALGRDRHGRWTRAGGLGPLLGDEGSAFWIGREGLRAGAGGTGLSRARRLARAPDAAVRIAALAPQLLRRARGGDRTARRIVAAAQRSLAELLLAVARDLHLPRPVSVSWAGRLLEDPWFRTGVWRATRRCGLQIQVRRPRSSAAVAAAETAQALAGRGTGR